MYSRVAKSRKNNKISKGLEAHLIEFDLGKIQCWLGRSRLNVFVNDLEHVSSKKDNERRNSMALYIRLE